MSVTSSLPSPASAPLAVRTTPPSANRGSRWFLKWTLAARAAAVMVRVRTIEKIAERFMRQLSFFRRAWIAECFSSPAYGRTGGARARGEKERAAITAHTILPGATESESSSLHGTNVVNPRMGVLASRQEADDTGDRRTGIEERPGFAGALRTLGGLGGHVLAPQRNSLLAPAERANDLAAEGRQVVRVA